MIAIRSTPFSFNDHLNTSLTREKTTVEMTDGNFMEYIKGGITFLKSIDRYYEKVNTPMKQKIPGSILDEKLIFENFKRRTPKYKTEIELIILNNNKLQTKKMGSKPKNQLQSRLVRPEGFEPSTLGAEIRYSIQLNYGRKWSANLNKKDNLSKKKLPLRHCFFYQSRCVFQ